MTWFHRTKLERFAKQRQERLESAEELRESVIREELFSDVLLIKDSLRETDDEPSLFEGYFGEPMPRHMQDAFTFERMIWEYLLDITNRPAPTEDAYRSLCSKLRPSMQVLCDVLHLEHEMLTTCLVRHYERLLDALRAEFSRVRVR